MCYGVEYLDICDVVMKIAAKVSASSHLKHCNSYYHCPTLMFLYILLLYCYFISPFYKNKKKVYFLYKTNDCKYILYNKNISFKIDIGILN